MRGASSDKVRCHVLTTGYLLLHVGPEGSVANQTYTVKFSLTNCLGRPNSAPNSLGASRVCEETRGADEHLDRNLVYVQA